MSNPGNSKSLRIKLRDPVEGVEKTFGSVGMEREKVVRSGGEIGSAVGGARNSVQVGGVGGSDGCAGSSRASSQSKTCEGARSEVREKPSRAVELEAGSAADERGIGARGPAGGGHVRASGRGERSSRPRGPAGGGGASGVGERARGIGPCPDARVVAVGLGGDDARALPNEGARARASMEGGSVGDARALPNEDARTRASLGGLKARERACVAGKEPRGLVSLEDARAHEEGCLGVPCAREGALGRGSEPGSGKFEGRIYEGADSRVVSNGGSFGRREIIESWSDDVETSIHVSDQVDGVVASRRYSRRQIVDFGSDSDDSNHVPLVSDHAAPK
ncbi:PREDICTED: circumsporozoite protein-like [Erythranthe guttata]|uniref:circumsporozoite protein-like n=1 Tax=Erythranthe guttata TaxID=4155 RepID=UPI00064DBC30|nr:PREDICTED: circumsporozoite protein-like [Erythranthe guttata]|eukprot:XP_012850063.1 PREDICTED: circumsporozoite protein-like [Erythranthe guttata]